MVAAFDAECMARALFLAQRGRGRTSPNPIVGAVIVSSSGVVVGQGAHLGPGLPHAEVVALTAAGQQARGATLYCTLEPCAHTGRTGPCVDAVIAAGIARVVVAVEDVNPRVHGAGLARLTQAGVQVVVGVGRDEAERQHAPFFTWITQRRPLVTAKAAVSADGFVGGAGGRVRLTGPATDRFFHRQRAEIDALAVGAGTVLADDPLLTARGAYRMRPLTRVITDWRGRIPVSSRVFSTLAQGPVIMFVSADGARRAGPRLRILTEQGVDVVVQDTPDLARLLAELAARDVLSLLVEGGPALHQALFVAGLVDRVQLVTTSASLGAGVPVAPGFAAEGRHAGAVRHTVLGGDELMEFDVHRIG